jgi:hypothetical protein
MANNSVAVVGKQHLYLGLSSRLLRGQHVDHFSRASYPKDLCRSYDAFYGLALEVIYQCFYNTLLVSQFFPGSLWEESYTRI